jgi:hypothetical protein
MISLNPKEAKQFLIKTEAKNTGMIETSECIKLFYPVSPLTIMVEFIPRDGKVSYYIIDRAEFLATI